MTDNPFDHDAKMEAGQEVLALFDALESAELQQHLTDARQAVVAAADELADRGFGRRGVALALVGFVLAPVLPDD